MPLCDFSSSYLSCWDLRIVSCTSLSSETHLHYSPDHNFGCFCSLTMDLTWNPNMHPEHYARNPWPGFGVLLGTNLLGLLIVLYRRDFVWTVAATWICVAEWSARPKATPVYVCHITIDNLLDYKLYLIQRFRDTRSWLYFSRCCIHLHSSPRSLIAI
jgi:hypothetical protein